MRSVLPFRPPPAFQIGGDTVVVVTGASSGIGRATAHAFAAKGANVVLVARSHDALHEVAVECKQRGGETLIVPADIADDEAMAGVTSQALERFGRIDVWVEAAGVLVAGPFGSESVSEIRRLVDTNIVGTVLGAREALAVFDEQDHGVLIVVSSLLGLVNNPLVPLYSMTKFAIRGLALNLQRFVGRRANIHVSLVLPGPVDTGLFQRAANHTGHQLRAIPPAVSPQRVAAAIVACAERPRHQTTVGVISHVVLVGHRLAPRMTEWAVALYSAATLTRGESQDDTEGWLFRPPDGGVLPHQWRLGAARRVLGDQLGRVLAQRDGR
jgi:short-subunit dehydrogenase